MRLNVTKREISFTKKRALNNCYFHPFILWLLDFVTRSNLSVDFNLNR
jgi:hypothetical protein